MRQLWTFDPDLIYLNHGSFGAVPLVTQQAQARLMAAAEANPMRWFRDLRERLVATRDVVGEYLGVSGSDLALVTNATAGVNVALRSVEAQPGQRFVLTSHAYGAVLLAAQRIAAERGCEVVVVDVAIDATDAEVLAALRGAVDDTTACIVIDQITSSTAKLMPVDSVAAFGRDRGVPVVVDGAHAPGLVDRPVAGDYWAGNLHKWPCAPRGTGVLYVDESRRDDVVAPIISWGDPMGFPVSFDTPGTMDATGWLATPTSLELLETLGFAEQRTQLGQLVAEGADKMAEAIETTVADVTRPAPTMRLVALPEGMASDDWAAMRLGAALFARSGVEVAVLTWQGRGFIRLSAHLYNTSTDYERAARRYGRLFADPAWLAAAALG